MAKIIKLENYRKREAGMIDGMYKRDKLVQYELYEYCANYYFEKCRGLFKAPDIAVEEILQNSFIKFWENIEARKIYAEENIVKGKDKKPLTCSIRTYFMGIAKMKYLEWVAKNANFLNLDLEVERNITNDAFGEYEYVDMFDREGDNIMLEIIADSILSMPTRCYEILTKFYYEGKNLDRIMGEMSSIGTKDALKSKKNKCMGNLRVVANEKYNRYLKNN